MLPEVFKFSNLWNILIYYGFLHEWKILLTRVNKNSSTVWNNNENLFINVGKDNKKRLEINKENHGKAQNWFELFELSVWVISDTKSI